MSPASDTLVALCARCRPDEGWPVVKLRPLGWLWPLHRHWARCEDCDARAAYVVSVPCSRAHGAPVAAAVSRLTALRCAVCSVACPSSPLLPPYSGWYSGKRLCGGDVCDAPLVPCGDDTCAVCRQPSEAFASFDDGSGGLCRACVARDEASA